MIFSLPVFRSRAFWAFNITGLVIPVSAPSTSPPVPLTTSAPVQPVISPSLYNVALPPRPSVIATSSVSSTPSFDPPAYTPPHHDEENHNEIPPAPVVHEDQHDHLSQIQPEDDEEFVVHAGRDRMNTVAAPTPALTPVNLMSSSPAIQPIQPVSTLSPIPSPPVQSSPNHSPVPSPPSSSPPVSSPETSPLSSIAPSETSSNKASEPKKMLVVRGGRSSLIVTNSLGVRQFVSLFEQQAVKDAGLSAAEKERLQLHDELLSLISNKQVILF